MAHYRKPLAAAVALNSAIFLIEAFAGFQANSLSLIMDSVHITCPTIWRLFSSIWRLFLRLDFPVTFFGLPTSSTRLASSS
jgi:Co/Zn/Cd efflux system component